MAIHIERASRVFSRIQSPEQGLVSGVKAFSHNLLGGLHVPLLAENAALAKQVISYASWNRMPVRAIDTLSTSDRKRFDEQFSSDDEKNQQHEMWLGRKAQQIMERTQERRLATAYNDILGLSMDTVRKNAKQEATALDQQAHPKRRSKKDPQPLPQNVVALVGTYQAYLASQRDAGATLSMQEEAFLSEAEPSRQLLETALTWEMVKDFLHTRIYVPFLKDHTDSKQLADFVLTNYAAAHSLRGVQVDDITEKAQLLYEDFDDMTARGHTVVALIRSAAVIATASQQKEAEEFAQAAGSSESSQQQELRSLQREQQRIDTTATEPLYMGVHAFTRELVRMIRPIHRKHGEIRWGMSAEDVANRTQKIIDTHILPLLNDIPLFTLDSDGNPRPPSQRLLYRLAHIPDLIQMDKALSLVQKKRYQMEQIALFREMLSQDPKQVEVASNYSLAYFMNRAKRGAARHIERALQESEVFQEHLAYLSREFGFLPQELSYLIHANILRAERGVYDISVHGRTELGPSARGPSGNEDRYFEDDRFKFVMAADGAGSVKWSKSSAVIMRHVSQQVMDELAQQGLHYPLSREQAQNALVEIVKRGADTMWDILPQQTKDRLMEEVVDDKGKVHHPHAHELATLFMTTFVGAIPFVENGVEYITVASVGDSRAYLHRASGELVQITRDHSYLWDFLRDYEKTGDAIDTILCNFDGEVPVTVSTEDMDTAVTSALREEVLRMPVALKGQVIEDMIDALSRVDLSMTLAEVRSSAASEKIEMIKLQEYLGDSPLAGVTQGVGVDDKVVAIAKFFYGKRNQISQYISIKNGYISPDNLETFRLNPGDTIYVVSDGVTDSVSDARIEETLNDSATLEESVDRVHSLTLAALGCERVGSTFSWAQNATMSIRAKHDNGITIGGLRMSRRLSPDAWGFDSDEENQLPAA